MMGIYRVMGWIAVLLMPLVGEAAIFIVTNVNDSGAGSLRQALLDVNASGSGPHTINFDPSLSGQTIFLSSSLPQLTVSDVTIDGDIDGDGNGDITIDAGTGDNTRNIFRANGNGNNATFKGFILQDTGYEPFRFDGSPSGITIQDIVSLHNDGNYFNQAILFAGNAVDLTVLNFTHNNPQSGQHGIQITGTADNILIDGFNYQNGSGGTAIAIRFVGAATNVTIRNSLLDVDLFGSNNDGDYGIYFQSSASDITLENVTINEADVDGVRVLDADNFTIDGCSFINCYDGVEFYNNYARTNNAIQNSVFDNNARAGLVINVANATTQYDISGNTFSNHTTNNGNGVWLFNTGGAKDIEITTNTFFNNNVGIYNEQADDVLYSQNSFYNNLVGIDNVANNGNNDYELSDGDVPKITSSVDLGGGNYNVSFSLPTFCTDCNVEFYTNESTDARYNGRDFVQSANNLTAGSHTITINSGGNVDGYWTAILTDNTNGSTSEISYSYPIDPKAPGGVIDNLAAWYKFNAGVTTSGGEGTGVSTITDMSGHGFDLSETSAGSQPIYVENSLNFNPGGNFDGGNDRLNGQYLNFVDETDPVTLITVSVPTSFGGERRTISIGDGYDRPGMGYQGAGGNMQIRVTEGGPATIEHSVPLTLNIPYILFASVTNGSNPGEVLMSYNGMNNEESSTLTDGIYPLASASSGGYIALGNEPNTYSDDHVGFINEGIVYNRVLENYEKERVYSYLAIKYGITLNQDYYAGDWDGSTGTKLWDMTFNALYNNDIAGIGRDDSWALHQKQSQSVNGDALVTIGLGGIEANNVSNANVFQTEESFLLWGNDDGGTTVVNAGIPPVFAEKLTRNWLIAETGSVEDVMVRIPSTLASGFTDASDLALVVADDANFSSNVQSVPMTLNGSYLEVLFNFEGTKYFSFGVISSGDFMRHGKYFQGGVEKPMKF
ncbi:right-handed parallel beta-helix repeat-containing protein [Flagellimonas taeanensis]|nr:right-handed parallel beta-helix repeat-containing protein [Allomuricauda taeanensis]